ncbi:hypothetical protein [Cellulosimicrobium funkei]|uniref:hypothetical protein n=1 Tax=Cellulosimicrobium funkei TaxID=264251 RepID=UPI003426823F
MVVVVLVILAVVAGGVPAGEALSYGIVLAIVGVPICALAGAALGGLVVLVRTRPLGGPVARAGDGGRSPRTDGGRAADRRPARVGRRTGLRLTGTSGVTGRTSRDTVPLPAPAADPATRD